MEAQLDQQAKVLFWVVVGQDGGILLVVAAVDTVEGREIAMQMLLEAVVVHTTSTDLATTPPS